MREFKADLHIHTCLSPCAELEMSPRNIVSTAKRRGLDVISICDHNSAENVPAVGINAAREGIAVIGGMEVTSKEEVHIVALFGNDEHLFSLQEIVYENLHGTNDEKLYGEQVIVNEEEEVLGFCPKLLIGATDLTLEKLVTLIHDLGGLAIAAHVDREGFGIIGQLGFIPDGLPLDALELADPHRRELIPQPHHLPFITASDAHTLDRIGQRVTTFFMRSVSLNEIKRCLLGQEGRMVRI
ncbi:MAG: PHP domain-containing protein [Blastocatellia bacterium]|nr:PHP domain-containing protein [Blastocatellia bacterium]